MPELSTSPKFIAITSIGLTPDAHDNLPLLLKPLYRYLLAGPHADKLGAERLLAHCSGKDWTDEEPSPEIMSGPLGNWSDREGLPSKGTLKDIVIIRPAVLTDGKCKGDAGKATYRASEQYLSSGYRVSRRDVAHFICTDLIKNWSKWNGRAVHIAY
jgi:hypothetical protein